MIIIKLMGGLASQLHKYAIGYAVAKELNVELKVDTTWFDNIPNTDTPRQMVIDAYDIPLLKASTEEIKRMRKGRFIRKGYNVFNKYSGKKISTYSGCSFFDKDYLARLVSPLYIEGEWFGDLLLQPLQAELKKLFSLKEGGGVFNRYQDDCASIHIRRGDFFSNPMAMRLHGVLTEEYYIKAMKLAKKCGVRKFFIFSDEIEWVRNNYSHFREFEVEYITANSDIEEFEMMRLFKFNITSNSGFSWLSAWLSDSDTIISPKVWVNDRVLNKHYLDNIIDPRMVYL
ncbi:alpha-1,2-fucosyltransferase [Aeromonas jandaei]|uniref:alpha-1,2-fucosyltransferase n=2 Tax=Aeromonas jandaei TaxID=650 RepID=UPI002B0525A3|nr:alpha-1,2-fucosyltransferase [Aeromonas jandaei]